MRFSKIQVHYLGIICLLIFLSINKIESQISLGKIGNLGGSFKNIGLKTDIPPLSVKVNGLNPNVFEKIQLGRSTFEKIGLKFELPTPEKRQFGDRIIQKVKDQIGGSYNERTYNSVDRIIQEIQDEEDKEEEEEEEQEEQEEQEQEQEQDDQEEIKIGEFDYVIISNKIDEREIEKDETSTNVKYQPRVSVGVAVNG